METSLCKPKVKMIGEDGNVFSILGRCKKASRQAGWSQEEWDKFHGEATSGDYNKVLQTVMQYFNVDGEEQEQEDEDEEPENEELDDNEEEEEEE